MKISVELRYLSRSLRKRPALDVVDGPPGRGASVGTGGGAGAGALGEENSAESSFRGDHDFHSNTIRRSDSWAKRFSGMDNRQMRFNRSIKRAPRDFARRSSPIESTATTPSTQADGQFWGMSFPLDLSMLQNPATLLSSLPVTPAAPDETSVTVHLNDLTITSVSAAYKFPNLISGRGLQMHTSDNCLSCYRLSRMRSRSGSMPAAIPATPTTLKGLVEQNHQQDQEEEGAEEKTSSRTEEEDTAVMQVIRRREVIKLVSCMNATVGAKTAEQGLLR